MSVVIKGLDPELPGRRRVVMGDKVVTRGFHGSLVTFVHVFHFNPFLEALTQSKQSTCHYPVQGEEDGIPALTLELHLQPAFPEQSGVAAGSA